MSDNNSNSRRTVLLVVLSIGLLFLAAIYLPKYLSGPSIESLKATALNDPSSENQIKAAQQLTQLGEPALTAIRIVAQQSGNPGVTSVCILALGREEDYESMDTIIGGLDHVEKAVRSSAATAITNVMGRDYHFPVEGAQNERDRIRDAIKKEWEAYNGSELFEFNKKRKKEKKNGN